MTPDKRMEKKVAAMKSLYDATDRNLEAAKAVYNEIRTEAAKYGVTIEAIRRAN